MDKCIDVVYEGHIEALRNGVDDSVRMHQKDGYTLVDIKFSTCIEEEMKRPWFSALIIYECPEEFS